MQTKISYGRDSDNLNTYSDSRLLWLDILKGIGIILVALGHVYKNSIFYNFVYAFHMPLFFMAAGWLYKEKPVLQTIKHRFYTVMVPYFSFGLITLIYWQLIERRFRDSDMTFFQSFIGLLRGELIYLDFNVHLWFLPCFFLTVVIYNCLRHSCGRKMTYFLVAVLSVVYILDVLPSLTWGLNCVCQYIGFYAIGNVMGEAGLDKRVKGWKWTVTGTAFLVSVSLMSLFELIGGIFWYVTGVLGTVGVEVFSIQLSLLSQPVINRRLSFLGRISLVILCTHGPIYRVIAKVLSIVVRMDTDAVRENFCFVAIIVAVTLVICSLAYIVIERILPFMIGKPVRRR